MRLKNKLKTIAVLLAFLGYSSAFADGLTSGTTPGYWMDDTDVTTGIDFGGGESAEWRIGHDILGDNIFCASSWVDSDVNNTEWPFCVSYAAPSFRLKAGPNGVGIGTFSPALDLHIKNIVDPPAIALENSDGNYLWYMASLDSTLDPYGSGGQLTLFLEDASTGTSETRVPFAVSKSAPTASLFILEDAILMGPSNLGIGTHTPAEAVDVKRSEEAARFMLTAYTSNGSEAPQYIQRRARGSYSTPYRLQNGDNIGLFSFRGHNGGSFTGSKAAITVQAAEAWTSSANGTKIFFATTENGTTSLKTRMEITHDGHIKVGGTQLNVPDYVFEEDYELMSLEDLDAYVKEQHHLPDVPSEATIKAEGLNVTKTQMLLLKKIEELTLYTIQQQEQIEAQRRDFQREIKVLQETLSRLATQSS